MGDSTWPTCDNVLVPGGSSCTVPGSFVPPEDQGYILVAAILPDGASLDRAEKVCDRISEIFTKEPAVKDAFGIRRLQPARRST